MRVRYENQDNNIQYENMFINILKLYRNEG